MSDAASLRFVYVRNLDLERPIRGFATLPPPSLRRRAQRAGRDSFANAVDLTIESGCQFLLVSGSICDPWECGPSAARFFRQQCQRLAEYDIALVWLQSHGQEANDRRRSWPEFLTLPANIQQIDFVGESDVVVRIEDCPAIRFRHCGSVDSVLATDLADRDATDCIVIGLSDSSGSNRDTQASTSSAADIVLQTGESTMAENSTYEIVTRLAGNDWRVEPAKTNAVRFESIEVGACATVDRLSEQLSTQLKQRTANDRHPQLLCVDVIVRQSGEFDLTSSDNLIAELQTLISTVHSSVWVNSLKTHDVSDRCELDRPLLDEVLDRFPATDARILGSLLVNEGLLDRATLEDLLLDGAGVHESAASTARACIAAACDGSGESSSANSTVHRSSNDRVPAKSALG